MLDDEVWANVRDAEILIGIPWANGRIDIDREPQPIHVYFPTTDKLGRALLVHGDFFLDSTRKHIQNDGAGGEISRVVAVGFAKLVADTASSIVEQHPKRGVDILHCLAPNDEVPPEGFGYDLAEMVDDALGQAAILRSCSGKPIAPKKSEIIGHEFPLHRAPDFVEMLRRPTSLVDPSYESVFSEWLERLGASKLCASSVITRLKPEKARSYDRAVRAVASWWEEEKNHTECDLNNVALLQDTGGSWRKVAELCTPDAGAPALPFGLSRASYSPPRSHEARDFLEKYLRVDRLTLENGLSIVLRAVKDGQYARNTKEAQNALKFARKVFALRKATLLDNPDRVYLKVAARKWRRGSKVKWMPAGNVYFSEDWTGSRDLESLYGPFGEREFLVMPKPSSKRGIRDSLRFYEAIGVEKTPRMVDYHTNWFLTPQAWRESKGVSESYNCPAGHPNSPRIVSGKVVDRLEGILSNLTEERSHALLNVLCATTHPYGDDFSVLCTNKSHSKRPKSKTATGIQRWLLETNEWIPVIRCPSGKSFLRPSDSWTDLNNDELRTCLGEARIPEKQARLLRIPQMTNPRPQELIRALNLLQENVPNLCAAPEAVKRGALLILAKLESQLSKRGGKEKHERPSFPSFCAGDVVWSEQPYVVDLPVTEYFDIAVLNPGNSWAAITAVFDLLPLSEEVSHSTTFDQQRPYSLLGDNELPALAAIIHKQVGADLKRVARRLGRLRTFAADRISTVFRHNEQTIEVDQPFSLLPNEAEADSADLVVVPGIEAHTFARELAAHIADSSADLALCLFLNSGSAHLRFFEITDVELREAEEAIGRYLSSDDAIRDSMDSDMTADESTQAIGTESTESVVQTNGVLGTAPAAPAIEGDQTDGHADADNSKVGSREHVGTQSQFDDISFELSEQMERIPGRKGWITGARGGTGPSGFPTISSETRKRVENEAMAIASRFAVAECGCVDVRDVHEDNLGWDLEFVFEDGTRWPVEVKGFGSGASSFIITRNELRAATETQPAEYRIVLVTGITKGKGQIMVLENPGAWLIDQELDPMSWTVTQWDTHVDRVDSWS